MKVALFASAFHPHVGGVEEVCRQLAHQQQAAGESPLIVTNHWPKDLPESEEFEGLPVRRYIFRVPERTWKQMGGALLYGPGTLNRLCADLKVHGANIIHIHCVSSNAYYALQAAKRLKLPLVVTMHSELTMDANRTFQRSAFAQKLYRQVLTDSAAITAVSKKTLEEAETFYGGSLGKRARVIYNGVPLSDFETGEPYAHPRRYILAIGRLVAQKGFDVLLEAYAKAQPKDHDILIAGDGVEKEALEARAQSLGLQGRVHFLGRADRAKTIALFKGCDFLALPSRADEGLPVVILECLAAGKPVVASRCGGVPEAVEEGVTGLLLPREDVNALAEAITRLTSDPALYARLSAGACARSQDFRWEAIAAQYAEVYRAL